MSTPLPPNIKPIGKGPADLAIHSKLMQNAVLVAITRLTIKLQGMVKQDKLSGQALNVRTGNLRRSINQKVEVDSATGPAGTVGTNEKYAPPHELGFRGEVQIREHLRTIKMAWGKPLSEPVIAQVRAHTKRMNLPERSFLRSALADIQPEITPTIEKEVVKANATTS